MNPFCVNSICQGSNSFLLGVNILELGKWISKNDALKILEITNACLFCKSEMDYSKLIERFHELIFFDYSISAFIDMQDISCENMNSCSINSGYPEEFLETYTNRRYQLIDPLYERFFKTLDIQSLDELQDCYKNSLTSPVLGLSYDFGFYNTLLYGNCGANSNPFTVLTITGERIKNEPRTKAIIKYLMPYLSVALRHLVPVSIREKFTPLSCTELEILKWLKEGKSSWEISAILLRSERVVNFHIGNIIRKFNANNRTHAVAIALENNIIVS